MGFLVHSLLDTVCVSWVFFSPYPWILRILIIPLNEIKLRQTNNNHQAHLHRMALNHEPLAKLDACFKILRQQLMNGLGFWRETNLSKIAKPLRHFHCEHNGHSGLKSSYKLIWTKKAMLRKHLDRLFHSILMAGVVYLHCLHLIFPILWNLSYSPLIYLELADQTHVDTRFK